MPQSLTLSTPPQGSIKRQRSQELPANVSRPTSSGQAPSNGPLGRPVDSAGQVNVKVPFTSTRPGQVSTTHDTYPKQTPRPRLLTDYAEISLGFQELEWKQRYRLQHALQNPHTSPFRVDRSTTVFNRNRYGNVQPWEASRIKLKNPIGGSDYVNASPITLTSHIPKSPRSGTSTPASTGQPPLTSTARVESRYIATQGPKEGQFSHFWHMVMQETPGEVGVIIMLTQHVEGNKEKCAQYYPADMDNPTLILPTHEGESDDGEPGLTDDGDPFLDSYARSADTDSVGTDSEASQTSDAIDEEKMKDRSKDQSQSSSITLLSLQHDPKIGCEVRKLRLTIDDESKAIYHYFFSGWPDFGRPEAEDRLALLELMRVSKAVAGNAPRIVHCSAGVGRTGAWIALDYLLQELEAGRLAESSPSQSGTDTPPSATQPTSPNGNWGRSGPPKASTPDPKDEGDVIWETVNTLREQRMMMVMNELQYGFIYEVLKEAFIEKYAEKETGPVVIEVQEPSPKVARKKYPSVFGRMYQGSRAGTVKGDEDTISDEGGEMEGSEAETEIMEREKGGRDVDMDDSAGADEGEDEEEEGGEGSIVAEEDPYAAVAPETIRQGQEKEEQDEVRDHEVK